MPLIVCITEGIPVMDMMRVKNYIKDKPVKYPLMFRACGAALINKVDLLPYLDLTIDSIQQSILQVLPDMPIFNISAKPGEGFDDWVAWLMQKVGMKRTG